MKACLGLSDTRNYRKKEETHVKQDLSTYVKTVEIERDVRKFKKKKEYLIPQFFFLSERVNTHV